MQLVDPVRYEQLKALGQMPSPSGVALAVVGLLQHDDYKIDDLVRLVQSDPAIAGNLLKFSNAASFGHARPVVSLSKAVATLGAHRVRILVLALSVLNNHRCGNCSQFDYERYWSRALAAAISAQELARYAEITPEENFTAGLLCSVGELAMASIFQGRYSEIIRAAEGCIHKRLALERGIFDTDHRELASTLLLEWGLPEILANAVYHCELPDEANFLEGSRIFKLTLSLHIARAMAGICVAEEKDRWTMLPGLYITAARLGVSSEELNSMAETISTSWLEWGRLLKVQTREITSFADLLASSPPREQAYAAADMEQSKMRALLICPESPESSEINGYLKTNGCAVSHIFNPADGLEAALRERPELIMIDIHTPGIDGAAFCHAFCGNLNAQASYIVVIANNEDDGFIRKALNMGADDFLLRPVTTLALESKIHGAFKILQLQKELVRERNSLVNSAMEWAGANRRLINVAMTDPLTHLSNRRHGMDFLSAEWAFANANNLPLACIMIDIDHFKHINDQNGHKAGDVVLVKLASLLQANTRSGDLVFRYGGEEFCMICPGATMETALAVAERTRQNIAHQHFYLENLDIPVTVSIGVSIMMPAHANEEALVRDADAALYRAKENGRNRVEPCIPAF